MAGDPSLQIVLDVTGRREKKRARFLLNQASSSTQLDLHHISMSGVMELSAVVRRYLTTQRKLTAWVLSYHLKSFRFILSLN